MLLQLLANGLISGCLFAILATGFALIYNTTRILHIGYGATYTLATYLCYACVTRLHWSLPWSIASALLLTALIGGALELLVFAPLERRRASLLVSMLTSLGVYIVLVNTIAIFFGNESQVLRPGAEATVQMGPVILTRVQVLQGIVVLVLLPSTLALVKFTPLGRTIRAVRDHPTLTQVMGINLRVARTLAFVLGSALAGVAAILSALDVGIEPNMGMPALLIAAIALIVGGVGTFEGAALGGFLVGVLQSLVVYKLSSHWTDALTFAVLILFLVFRPQGLVGRRQRLEEAAP